MILALCFGRHSSSSMVDGPGQVRWDAELQARRNADLIRVVEV